MWEVELQAVIYLEPVDAQAHNLAVRLREDERVVHAAGWERTPGALGGPDERRALTMRCVVRGRSRDDARLLADRVLGDAIEALILADPPGLFAPVLTEIGRIEPAHIAEIESRSPDGARAC